MGFLRGLVLAGSVPLLVASCSDDEQGSDDPLEETGGSSAGGEDAGGLDGGGNMSGSGGSAGGDAGSACLPESCQSGVCAAEDGCSACMTDEECLNGTRCASGVCLAECSTAEDCPAGFECCGDRCADVSVDFTHCGACDAACSGEQFCDGVQCAAAGIASVCDAPEITLLLDELSVDDAETENLRAALASACPGAVSSVSQWTSGVINPDSGKPVLGSGELVVVVGGPYGQLLVRYLESAGHTRVYNTYDPASVRFYDRSEGGTGTLLMDVPESELTDQHSYFMIESVVDPDSHTWVLELYGLSSSGTSAAVWFFTNRLLPDLSQATSQYYVYEWDDTSGDSLPSEDDTFTLLAP